MYCIEHYLEKGVEINYNNNEYFKSVLYPGSLKVINFFVDRLGLPELDNSFFRAMLRTESISFLSKLVDLGLGIHIDNDRILKTCFYMLRSFPEVGALIKRLLDLGSNLHSDCGEYDVLHVSDKSRFEKTIPKPDSRILLKQENLLEISCLYNSIEVMEMLILNENSLASNNSELVYKFDFDEKLSFIRILLKYGGKIDNIKGADLLICNQKQKSRIGSNIS
ncbi:hypothetical protein BB559_003684 [Furculomyces boomerangus]|uniref:Uncharacterized protein n=2 Tax=Harpellales TaxID=61421 RepID=A0A2T9YJP9_9FUNG|nr:hypothetical protein BB559_003684 [Furculomyces boomerangus]PVZ97651.1 hypothetical protein BB558_006384 [Smittium angustum]